MTCEVERLDFTRPPPGYHMTHSCGVWVSDERGDLIRDDESFDDEDNAIAAAWDHYKASNDPPGMQVFEDPGGDWCFEVICDGAGDDSTTNAAARAAAWAWYERRLALARRLSTGPFAPLTCECARPPKAWDGKGASLCRHVGDYLRILAGDWWPRCLAWSDAQVAEVERWLVEGGEVPEVLR